MFLKTWCKTSSQLHLFTNEPAYSDCFLWSCHLYTLCTYCTVSWVWAVCVYNTYCRVPSVQAVCTCCTARSAQTVYLTAPNLLNVFLLYSIMSTVLGCLLYSTICTGCVNIVENYKYRLYICCTVTFVQTVYLLYSTKSTATYVQAVYLLYSTICTGCVYILCSAICTGCVLVVQHHLHRLCLHIVQHHKYRLCIHIVQHHVYRLCLYILQHHVYRLFIHIVQHHE